MRSDANARSSFFKNQAEPGPVGKAIHPTMAMKQVNVPSITA
jgi:hypothetical protein